MPPNWRRPLLSIGLWLSNPATSREMALLRRIQFDTAAVQQLHEQRLTALLRHAWSTTDYYRQVLSKAGVVRDGTVDLARFSEIPCLTKDILRNEFDRLASRALPAGRRPYANASGGSTGQPSRFMQDNIYWDVNVATKLFHFEWFGKRLGDRELKIWGSEYDLIKGREGLASRLKGWLYSRRSEQCFSLPEERVREIIERINTFRPTSIWAYRDGMDVIAQYINRHGLKVHRPAAVFLGGGTIYPHIVEVVEQAFGTAVVSLYGGRETGDVACQCPERGGLHISMNAHKVEVIGADGRPLPDGNEGELAITPLHNYAMPLIRYRVGDRATALSGKCPCGRGFPMLGAVSGRVIERLVNARGDSIDPIFFIHVVGVVANEGRVRRFQIVQEAADWLVVNMVLEKGVDRNSIAPELAVISEKVRLVMGPECRIDYCFVDDIPLTASGKHAYVLRRTSLDSAKSPSAAAA